MGGTGVAVAVGTLVLAGGCVGTVVGTEVCVITVTGVGGTVVLVGGGWVEVGGGCVGTSVETGTVPLGSGMGSGSPARAPVAPAPRMPAVARTTPPTARLIEAIKRREFRA